MPWVQSVTNLIFADCTMTEVASSSGIVLCQMAQYPGGASVYIYRGPVCYPRMPDLARFFTTAPAALDPHQPSPNH